MPEIASQVEALYEKVGRLIAVSEHLKTSNESLQEQTVSLQEVIREQEKTIKELKEKIKVLKLARSVSDDSEKKVDIKQKINEFVREIDKCITLIK